MSDLDPVPPQVLRLLSMRILTPHRLLSSRRLIFDLDLVPLQVLRLLSKRILMYPHNWEDKEMRVVREHMSRSEVSPHDERFAAFQASDSDMGGAGEACASTRRFQS